MEDAVTGAEAVSDARDGCARKGGAGSAAKAGGHVMASIQEDDELEQESEAQRTPLLRMPPGAAEDAAAQETPARLEEDGTLEEQRVLEELAQNAGDQDDAQSSARDFRMYRMFKPKVHVHAWPPSLHNTQGSKRRRKAAVPIELQERHDISRRKAAEKMREEAVRRRQHKDRRSKAWKACRMEKAPKSTYSGGQSTALVKDPVVVTPDISSCRGSGASPGSASLGVVSDNVQRHLHESRSHDRRLLKKASEIWEEHWRIASASLLRLQQPHLSPSITPSGTWASVSGVGSFEWDTLFP